MAILREEKGAALVTALMLTMLSLVISMALLYSVTMGTKISASQKRYRTALAAAHGGVELFTREIIPLLFQSGITRESVQSQFSLVNLQLPQYACLQQKLNTPTGKWTCADPDPSDPTVSPDVTFQLSGSATDQGFNVSAKIVDSVPGNTDNSGMEYLDAGNSVAGTDEVIHPQHVPGLYDIAVQGVRRGGNNSEKARLSVLYAY